MKRWPFSRLDDLSTRCLRNHQLQLIITLNFIRFQLKFGPDSVRFNWISIVFASILHHLWVLGFLTEFGLNVGPIPVDIDGVPLDSGSVIFQHCIFDNEEEEQREIKMVKTMRPAARVLFEWLPLKEEQVIVVSTSTSFIRFPLLCPPPLRTASSALPLPSTGRCSDGNSSRNISRLLQLSTMLKPQRTLKEKPSEVGNGPGLSWWIYSDK